MQLRRIQQRIGAQIPVVCLAVILTAMNGAQETTRVSVDSSGIQGSGKSQDPSLSTDGRFVAFGSFASDLVPGDTNGAADVFIHDRWTGVTERVSVDSAGVQGNYGSSQPALSADGRFVAFSSHASNLVAGDTNQRQDVFVHDRTTGLTERVSVDSAGIEGDADSGDHWKTPISADGQVVAFQSQATNLVAGDTNGVLDVFVHDRTTGVTERVSVDSSGSQVAEQCWHPSLSGDGWTVAFQSASPSLVPGDTNGKDDAFVHDRRTGVTERVSLSSSGAQGDKGSGNYTGLSTDGALVLFSSYATNFHPRDSNGSGDVFLRDRTTDLTTCASVDPSGIPAGGAYPAMSRDGRFVTFSSSYQYYVPGDTNGERDVFLHDHLAQTVVRVSVDSAGGEGDGTSGWIVVSPVSDDGRVVAFESEATNLVAGDTNGVEDVFAHERGLAWWENYGKGFPGTKGVPSITPRADPMLGTDLVIDIENSAGAATIGLLFLGTARAHVHSVWGGDLLVWPDLTVALDIPAAGAAFFGTIPSDEALTGLLFDLQAIQADAGAAAGVSFTPGLELVLGY